MTSWFYLSFADGRRPKGEQFLGGAYIRGETIVDTQTRSHLIGVNPAARGEPCEVLFQGPVSEDVLDQFVPAELRERLLTREEVEAGCAT